MKKALYILECAVLLVLLLPLALNYSARHGKIPSFSLPNSGQIKTAISTTPQSTNDNVLDFNSSDALACDNSPGDKIGFPFVYKTDDNCKCGTNYNLGLFLDYLSVIVLVLVIVKLTSVAVNRITKK